MRDMYPGQARQRRMVENRLLAACERHGFELVSCGTFEYVDTLLRGRSTDEAEHWVRLFDASGRTMALRPELTPSIARMAAPLVQAGAAEVRWCYAERVYHRSDEPASLSWAAGRAAESTQVGVEWIGPPAGEIDATLLAICESGLRDIGVTDAQLVLSHARFAEAYLEACGVPSTGVPDLLDCLVRGDYVGFRRTLGESGQGAAMPDLLRQMSALNPFRPETLHAALRDAWQDSAAGQRALAVWDELVRLADQLQGLRLRTPVTFDLTLHRDLSYYTGVVFEVFVPGTGAPVAQGGRYDDLLAQFGAPAPAIGFTYEVERLTAAQSDGDWLDIGAKEG
ncbi:MAG: ATP phosphoribosyltransferase regulatory subunit [Alicyclobacillus sp.]|nr:ATP phosphoribosyltransferase regulatory subunit [Alicyclobacillus sp.]